MLWRKICFLSNLFERMQNKFFKKTKEYFKDWAGSLIKLFSRNVQIIREILTFLLGISFSKYSILDCWIKILMQSVSFSSSCFITYICINWSMFSSMSLKINYLSKSILINMRLAWNHFSLIWGEFLKFYKDRFIDISLMLIIK